MTVDALFVVKVPRSCCGSALPNGPGLLGPGGDGARSGRVNDCVQLIPFDFLARTGLHTLLWTSTTDGLQQPASSLHLKRSIIRRYISINSHECDEVS